MNKKIKKRDNYRTTKVLGVRVDFVSLKKVLSEVDDWVKSNKQYQITTPNPEHIVLAQSDYRFKKIINNSAFSIADGVGLGWAASLLSKQFSIFNFSVKARSRSAGQFSKIFKRLSGIDLMQALCKKAGQKKWRVFLLGGKNDAAKNAALKLRIANCELKIENSHQKLKHFGGQAKLIDYHSGAANVKKETINERNEAMKKINDFKPDLLFVAFGAPMQEKWIFNNLDKLNVKVAMGVGGAFDYLAGKVRRAPRLVQKLSLEWLWRLICQPWRIGRQLRLLKFVYLVIRERLNL